MFKIKLQKNNETRFYENESSFCVTESDGTKKWYSKKRKLHRENGPALKYTDGSEEWFMHGKHHRKNGPAVKEADGTEYWFFNGQLHREDGPAVILPLEKNKKWFRRGKLHRLDGPAVEYEDGRSKYCLNDKFYSYEEWVEASLREHERPIYGGSQ